MRVKVRSIYSSDVDVDAYVPSDPEVEGLWIRLIVGPAGGSAEESLDVLVCTPLWLRRVVAAEGPQLGYRRLIIEPFDLTVAKEYLREVIENIDAPDWSSLAQKLAKLGSWEFDDYH